ncbi:MAG: DNA polymerase III subunit alpha [Candidatus Pacebacteria bacterium]|nr:DNA polymerase III subunit alpha [Candidatus Paceibacterota bacterium]MDD5752689.1 DNA polymerase III subunit alpha [Candidatus Paceibacterota bacterium]
MSKFIHLHVHSHYSLLDGLSKIDDILDRIEELEMNSVALTDHGVVYGAVEFYEKAKKRGIKPIIGCEVYESIRGMEDKESHADGKRYHLVLLVKNQKGYDNLVKIVTESHLKGFYYKPRIDIETLKKYSEGLIALSACMQGKVPRLLLLGKAEEAEKAALEYEEIFGKGNFFLELQHHPYLPDQEKANKLIIELSKKTNIPLVATNDCHYARKDDAEAQDILMLINTGADRNDKERLTMKEDNFSIKSQEEMIEDFKDVPEAIKNTLKIAEMCSFEMNLGEIKLPMFDVPDNKTSIRYLRELCYLGIKEKYNIESSELDKIIDNVLKEKENKEIKSEKLKEIIERLEYELSVIDKAGFSDYFLIVQDFVNWAKGNRIVVGPGRGSAGGSIVAYLTNITNVDPLKYNLYFQRFLNPDRISPPDIDLDFTDKRRDEVINYVAEKYGRNRVAQIITFGTMAARASIRDVGRALDYQYSYCDKIAKMIPLGFTLRDTLEKIAEFKDLYEHDTEAEKLIDLALKIEGCARHASTHACGVVISRFPLDNLVPLQHPTQNENAIVTQYEMHAIESMGLLKMDFLGLKNLTIIEETLKRIYAVRGKNIDIEKISLDDKKTFDIFRKGDCVGVFQLECLSGDTIVSNTTIKKLYEQKDRQRLTSVYFGDGKAHLNKIVDVLKSGEKDVYTLIAENDWYIKSTKNHYFLTRNGWKKLKDLKKGDEILMKNKAKHLIYNTCQKCGKQIDGQKEGRSNFCYKCSASYYKNPSKGYSRKNISKAKKAFYEQGGKPWNYGITIENNEKWRETAIKISKALKGRSLEELWGKERADEFKRAHSERVRGENNPMFGKSPHHRKGGFREDLGHYVRSSWEADFARILKLYNLDYEYEPKTFSLKRENGEIINYTPDFYVPEKNTFYEIKGWMHDLDKEKINLFIKQYPYLNFVLIDTTRFAELALKYKDLVSWECPKIPEKSFEFVKIKEIKYCGKEMTYDIAMEAPGNNFVANGFLVHNSDGMRRYLKQLKPTEIDDIIAMVALYRPGPMQHIPDYIRGKHNKATIKYIHPKLKPILESTYGIPLYQEQIMRIAQDMAGFTLSEADILRKAIGKKIEKLLMEQKEKFVDGMKTNNINEKIAEEIWHWIEPFARYSFNKSHAACYAIIAYQTAYLKANYPVEYMAALLTSESSDIERIATLIQECNKMGLEVLPPDINESFSNFSVVPDKNEIRFGLTAIKNVGYNIVEQIIDERKVNGRFESIQDFVTRVNGKVLNKKSLESLIKAGVFDSLEERNKILSNIESLIQWSKDDKKIKESGQKGLFGGTTMSVNFTMQSVDAINEYDKLNWEKELLGLYVSGHPLEKHKELLDNMAMSIKRVNADLSGQRHINPRERYILQGETVTIGGIISSIKRIITKKGQPMMFIKLEDLTDRIEVVVFPSMIEKMPELFQENKIVTITGKTDIKDGSPKIIANEIEEILES